MFDIGRHFEAVRQIRPIENVHSWLVVSVSAQGHLKVGVDGAVVVRKSHFGLSAIADKSRLIMDVQAEIRSVIFDDPHGVEPVMYDIRRHPE
ncbi:MAG: hypothetical protein FJX06_07050 [Alphaproteobacteria bacterium]|nr:hypothetical protein [Alphaproteobacteria bacterium]